MKATHWIRAGSMCAALCASAGMGADVSVVKVGAAKTAIDTSGLTTTGGAAAGVFRAVLERDLARTGWFTVVAGDRAAIAARGNCAQAGALISVSCRVESISGSRMYLNSMYRGEAGTAHKLAHKVADDIVWAVKEVKGISSSRIAFIGSRGGKKEVYVCDADGHGLTQVTSDGALCLSPAWSHDGKSLVYTSFIAGYPDVYLIDMAHNKRRRVSSFSGLNTGADFSPDGRSIALTLSKDGNPELYVLELGSRRLTRLTMSKYAAEASPSWSPDGREIVFVSDRSGSPQLYVMSRRGGASRRISLQGRENVAPDWGPDGRIAFSSQRGGHYQLCVVDPDLSGETRLTSEAVDHEEPSWAPDGRHLVYARTDAYRSSLYVLDTRGDAQVRLTKLPGDWYSPAWSP